MDFKKISKSFFFLEKFTKMKEHVKIYLKKKYHKKC